MKVPTLHYTVGLPGSGKTIFALNVFVEWERVNRDEIREELFGRRTGLSGKQENKVTELQFKRIAAHLALDHDVMVDDTNLNPKTVAKLEHVARELGAEIRAHDFTHVPLRTCIKQDLMREHSVGEDVIRMFHEKYLARPRELTGKPKCVIVDMDGTLAINGGRSPYDWAKVGIDSVNHLVANLVADLYWNHDICVVSGRDSVCRKETEEWLLRNLRIQPEHLFMRPEGDKRPDHEVKQEILDNLILPFYDPILAVDDRQQVVDMWRDNGIECWQVAPGRF